MTHEPADAETTINEIIERLSERFPSQPTTIIRDAVTQAYDDLDGAHVRDFIEVLVEKDAKKRLKQLATDTS